MKFLDLEDPGTPDVYSADICIVGSGPAGTTIARELLRSGLRVILVESGGLTENAETHALYDGDTVGHTVYMMHGRHRVFGGSGTQWGGRCALLDPIDFEQRDWIGFSGWPFGYEDLLPYYERAKSVSNFENHWIDDDSAAKLLKAAPKPFAGGKLQRMVWRVASPDLRPSLRTYLTLGYRKHFDYGKAYRSELEQSPTTQVLLNANMVGMATSADGRRVEEIAVSTLDGRRARVRAGRFVLATSGIENARQLLIAPPPLRERANRHDLVGRLLSQHPRGDFGEIVVTHEQARRIQSAFHRFLVPPRVPVQYEVGFALTEAAQREHKLVNASAALVYYAHDNTPWKAGKRLMLAIKRLRTYRGMLPDALKLVVGTPAIAGNVARRYLLGRKLHHTMPSIHVEIDLEQVPNPESRILLSFRRDRFGNPLARADWRIAPIERRTARFFADALDEELRLMDLGYFKGKPWLYNDEPLSTDDLFGNYHFIGTTRMDADATRGVVDPDCRVHGVENLYCAGASVFPTGGHANPTLTIVALAIRLADHLKSDKRDVKEKRNAGDTFAQDMSANEEQFAR